MIPHDLTARAMRIRAGGAPAFSRVALSLALGFGVAAALAVTDRTRAAEEAKPAAGTFTDGQKVQVREGDSWSAATILKREGRKYLVHYDGADASSDEWVTTDRLRLPGA